MSTGIEFYYNQLCPFFMDNEFWKRSESSGNANILFYDKRIAREISALYKFHTFNFIKIVNRTNKVLIRTDIAGALHLNPTITSLDNTGTLNQTGQPKETLDSPPFSLGILFPEIERYKKIHLDQFDELDLETQGASLFGYPYISKEEARSLREAFNSLRQSDGGNPGSKSYDLGQIGLMNSYGEWPKKLMIAPDSDYPDGNLFKNDNFQSTTTTVVTTNAIKPDEWDIEFPTDGPNKAFSPTLTTVDGEKVVHIKSGYSNFAIAPKNESLWDWYGIYKKFKCTPIWKRDFSSPSRYRHMFISLDNLTPIDNEDSLNYTGDSLTLSDDYFWNKIYSSSSDIDPELWETDRNTDEDQWFNFSGDGTVSYTYGATTKIRHEYGDPNDSSSFNQYFSNFNARYMSNILGGWTSWNYLDIKVSEDGPLGVSPIFILGERTINTKYKFEMGQKGGRGNAFKLELTKDSTTNVFLAKYINTSDFDNRKIYEGDIFSYELNVDSSSVDNNFYIRLGIVDDSEDDDSSIIYTTESLSSSIVDDWNKFEIDLTPYVGKYIRRIEFCFEKSNTTLGRCIAYFNEVQFINNRERFGGRQFAITARYKTSNLQSPDSSIDWEKNKPHFKFSIKTENEFSDIRYKILDMHYYGEENSGEFKWIKGIVQIPNEHNCSELIVGVGIYKNVPEIVSGDTIGPYGTKNNGGYLEIERVSLEPTSRLYMAGVYSLDKGNGADEFGSNNFVELNGFGWKAWAVQILAKYFEVWDGA